MMGKEKITRNDIAEAAKVSPSTVSRALSGSPLLPPDTIARIKKIAGEMGYHPNRLARSFSQNRSHNIGFAVPHNLSGGRRGTFSLNYFSGILDALVLRSVDYDYKINILPYKPDADDCAAQLAGQWQDKSVDGIVLAGLAKGSKVPDELKKLNMPFVLVGMRRADCSCVNFDHTAAMRELLKQLEQRKCEKVFFAGGDMDYDDALWQRRQLLDIIKHSSVKEVVELSGDYSRRSGFLAAPEIIKAYTGGDAIIMANDRMASGFYRYCWENAIDVSRFAIAGFDDAPESRMLYPELTTIKEKQSELGSAAFEILLKMIRDNEYIEQQLISSEFIRRKSL